MTACLVCGKPYVRDSEQWWHFDKYMGNHGRTFHGKTLTGSACQACASRIYDEPGFYEQCVAAQEVLKSFGPKP